MCETIRRKAVKMPLEVPPTKLLHPTFYIRVTGETTIITIPQILLEIRELRLARDLVKLDSVKSIFLDDSWLIPSSNLPPYHLKCTVILIIYFLKIRTEAQSYNNRNKCLKFLLNVNISIFYK